MVWSLPVSPVEGVEVDCYCGCDVAGCNCAGEAELHCYRLAYGSAGDVHVDSAGCEDLVVDAAILVEVAEG